MGRRVLVSLAVFFLALSIAACVVADAQTPEASRDQDTDPHADLTCAACHAFTLGTEAELIRSELLRGDAGDLRAPSPEARCSASGCHTDGGPREVSLNSVVFEHRGHAAEDTVAPSCAGCHTHDSGDEPLVATVDACALCHLTEQAAGNAGECRLCHQDLSHAGTSSQGLAIPHEDLPWIDGGCVRCHYDLTDPPVDVSPVTCTSCHPESSSSMLGVGEDLHPDHEGFSCTTCHTGDRHGIQAMSSAVSMDCQQCHEVVHNVDVSPDFPGQGTCNDCHAGTHASQQRLLLGVVPGLDAPEPSEKFMDGLTCRSCHASTADHEPEEAVYGSTEGCLGCHREEFGTVLEWWQDGTRDRAALVASSLARARQRLPDESLADVVLDSAQLLVDLVQEGRGVHNLALSHALLVTAQRQIERAWTTSGRTPPPSRDLGREPSMGLCSYCHYGLDDPWVFSEMSGQFHREVRVGRRPGHSGGSPDGER